mmetsp:Transcript_13216/g.19876  ORF Transcript_13216/g.19876 Transcript_13216/m.19876 type:complete len:221 (-) Transcript_13216:880-1542(-)
MFILRLQCNLLHLGRHSSTKPSDIFLVNVCTEHVEIFLTADGVVVWDVSELAVISASAYLSNTGEIGAELDWGPFPVDLQISWEDFGLLDVRISEVDHTQILWRFSSRRGDTFGHGGVSPVVAPRIVCAISSLMLLLCRGGDWALSLPLRGVRCLLEFVPKHKSRQGSVPVDASPYIPNELEGVVDGSVYQFNVVSVDGCVEGWIVHPPDNSILQQEGLG